MKHTSVIELSKSALSKNIKNLTNMFGAHVKFASVVKGNAYGLANTLFQTAILKPCIKNKKLDNLYFCGQLTVPGPGVPPSLISGNVVAKELLNKIN